MAPSLLANAPLGALAGRCPVKVNRFPFVLEWETS